MINFIFVFSGVIDQQRKNYAMKVITFLISPEASKHHAAIAIFPRINFMCPKSMIAWLHMRNCVIDMMQKFTLRIFVYSSIFLAFYAGYAIILLLNFFEFITLKIPFELLIYSAYDSFVVLSVLLFMLIKGTSTNNEYKK